MAGKDADPKAWQRHVERSRTPPGAARASQRGRTLPDTALDGAAIRVRRALISVSDKTGVADFARTLAGHGVEILSTGGTAARCARRGWR